MANRVADLCAYSNVLCTPAKLGDITYWGIWETTSGTMYDQIFLIIKSCSVTKVTICN